MISPKGCVEAASSKLDAVANYVQGSVPSVVYQCSSDLTVAMVSPNILELLGIRPEMVLGNQSLWEQRLLEEDRARLHALLSQLRESEVVAETHRILDDRRLPIWVAHTFRKVKVREGLEVHGCMLPLAADFRAKFLDSSTIAQFVHKIGNHFQLINLLIGSLRRTEANLDELEPLQSTIDRAVDFVQSFSRFSQSITVRDSFRVAELLHSLTKSSFWSSSVDVQVILERSLDDAALRGDAFLLEFAFCALLQNAIEATGSGAPVVIRGSREMPVGGGRANALIAIHDSGHGIEANRLGKVAEPFFSSRRDRDGLGLSSAVRIFEIHGGGVRIFSVSGRGTEVQVVLPIEEIDEQYSVNHV